MADQQEEEPNSTADEVSHRPLACWIPTHRVKKIMKLDKEVKKINSEAAFLVSASTELFLQLLAEKSAQVALEKKKKTIKLEHLRIAVRRHQPTSDFLLDSLPLPAAPQPSDQISKRPSSDPKPPPAGTRRIEAFFNKCS
ncbi:OLC1v1028654C1 [Oldenlandia corymbosa var. corymbosa]|uniref:OLC1v1028654C1 n=1 Tax=Oldenlandia corymbosa var. corymbosa TaxID=529605 RepID=A0AAV1CCG7_OLDCO|nr:OLC1v1028654C1 [Oldenlandia corymbosa var. corymbosa]